MTSNHFSTPEAMTETFRIMLVDDTAENLSLLRDMLSHRGYEIAAFPSGSLALRAAEKNPPDLVLLDIGMPDMDGYEVCTLFKQSTLLSDVPVIFLSALSEIGDKVKGFNLGAVDYITKPFQFEEVFARVTTHLQLRNLRQRLEYQNRHLQEIVDAKVKELAEAHRESHRRLAEIAHMNRNFTSTVYSAAIAHELRQPLAAILSNAEAAELFLDREPPSIEIVKEILADIRRDDKRASDVVQHMRNMLNKTQTTIVEIEINAIIDDVISFLAAEARMRGVEVSHDRSPVAANVLADRIQIQQVMINLVLNGMDAMTGKEEGRRSIDIRTRVDSDSQVEVIVSDSGTGFRHIEHAFESFFTTKPEGMGMGLSITAALIHAHGGKIWAENNLDCGASVHFKLPLRNGALS